MFEAGNKIIYWYTSLSQLWPHSGLVLPPNDDNNDSHDNSYDGQSSQGATDNESNISTTRRQERCFYVKTICNSTLFFSQKLGYSSFWSSLPQIRLISSMYYFTQLNNLYLQWIQALSTILLQLCWTHLKYCNCSHRYRCSSLPRI